MSFLKTKFQIIFKDLNYYVNLNNIENQNFDNLSRNEIYKYFLFYFYKYLPKDLVKHRLYFSKLKRGFGEDAFHSMWFYLFKKFQPKNILEIGVYRGQTLSLFSILSNLESINSNVYGISPLNDTGDSVSSYIDLNYEEDIKFNFKYFDIKNPSIIKTNSGSKKAIEFINSKKWVLIMF